MMRVLISLVLWAAVSIPFALGLGRALHKPNLAEEVEAYLRGSRVGHHLRRVGAITTVLGLLGGVVLLSTEAVRFLPTTAELGRSIAEVTFGRPATSRATARQRLHPAGGSHVHRSSAAASSAPGIEGVDRATRGSEDPGSAVTDVEASHAPAPEESRLPILEPADGRPEPEHAPPAAAPPEARSSESPHEPARTEEPPTTTTTTTEPAPTRTTSTPPPPDADDGDGDDGGGKGTPGSHGHREDRPAEARGRRARSESGD